jgi:hypothetical protein
MPRVGDVFQLLSGTLAVPNTTIQSAPYNAQQQDWVTEANTPRPISAGGTGETTAAEARESLGAIGADDLIAADTKANPVGTDSVVLIDSEWAGGEGEEDDTTKYKRWLVSDITNFLNDLLSTFPIPTAQARNRIVNPAMQISQEHGGAGGAFAVWYAADQWVGNHSMTGTVTYSRMSATTPDGLSYQIRALTGTIDTTIAATEYMGFYQPIEGIRIADFGWGTAQARQVVLRFTATCGVAGTFGGAIRNAAENRSYPFSYTIATGEINTPVTVTVVIPGETTGSWPVNTDKAMEVCFTFMAGTDFTAAPNIWGSTAAKAPTGITNGMAVTLKPFQIANVGLYLDPNNTGLAPPWQMPDEAQELIACRRYWEEVAISWGGMTTNASIYWSGTVRLVPKRDASPPVTGVNGSNNGFAATVGTLSATADYVVEHRTATSTSPQGLYSTTVTVNARFDVFGGGP